MSDNGFEKYGKLIELANPIIEKHLNMVNDGLRVYLKELCENIEVYVTPVEAKVCLDDNCKTIIGKVDPRDIKLLACISFFRLCHIHFSFNSIFLRWIPILKRNNKRTYFP